MFNIDAFLRVATAAVGALVLTTVAVGAAVGPSTSIEADSIYAQAPVSAHTEQAHA